MDRERYGVYAKFAKELPVGLVVTPTKGLASKMVRLFAIMHLRILIQQCQVTELARYNIPAFAYTSENIASTRRSGRNIVEEIASCLKYRVIFVDPEHLNSDEWRKIAESDTFSRNQIFACAEETHLIIHWGASFRKEFKNIGAFFRGRLNSNISVFALSATLPPGRSGHTSSVATSEFEIDLMLV
jgi:hypothetical protein